MTSSGVEKCISQAMAADGTASAEVKRELSACSLLTICKAMREYFCEMDRVQPAMRLLASVAVGRKNLSAMDVQFLFTFYSEKLWQSENQTTALSCLALLIDDIRTRYQCAMEWFDTVAPPFLKHVRVQQLPLNCRRQCFCIMTFLFTESMLPRCGSDVLGTLLELLDGEGDPELVLQAFDLHVVIATRATHGAFLPVLDDYFESVSSYFPVVFSQPPGCKVTKVELRTHLKRCLCLSVYSGRCIPFMQAKLASPSIAVKEDVMDALLTCFDTYQHSALDSFYPSLVANMKNEVVKLSSYSDRASDPSLTKCISVCCEVLGRISKACGAKNQTEVLEVFSPVLEGFLSALSGDVSISSAYATMVFHVLTGSWSCCLFVSAYLFSMLSMSLSGAEHPANVYILFASLVTGMVDALVAFPADGHVESLRDRVERSTPLVVEAVRQCASRWGLTSSTALATLPSAAPPSDGVDDFTVICGCEFVVAVMKLSLRLSPWLAVDVVRDGIDTLIQAALCRSTETAAKVCKLLRDYAAEDGDGVYGALTRLLQRSSDVPAEAGLAVVGEVASSTTAALLLAYQANVFNSCSWMAAIPAAQKARALQAALDHFGDALQSSTAEQMAALLSCADVPPDYFYCACLVAKQLSDAACVSLAASETALSELGVAALLAGRETAPVIGQRWSAVVDRLAALTTCDAAAWRRVGMEGVTGATRHGAGDGASPKAAVALPAEARLLTAVATLWGGLLADDGATATARHAELVASFAQAHMRDDAAAEVCGSGCIIEAFTYLPFCAQKRASRPSLLYLLLLAGTGAPLQPCVTLCTAVRCLVESETELQVRSCLPALLDVLHGLVRSHFTGWSAAGRALLFSVNVKCSGDATLARDVLFSDALLRLVLDGVGDVTLATRQRSLQVLTSLARGVFDGAGDWTQEEKALLVGVRDRVIGFVRHALGDHKRKVRQAAVACVHEWYKVR